MNWKKLAGLLAHYLIVVLLPLGVTAVLFLTLEHNYAEYANADLGIKLTGPIAVYVSLLVISDRMLRRLFTTWRDEEQCQRLLRETDLSIEQAMSICRRVAELLSRYIVVEILLDRRSGYTSKDFTGVMSRTRKKIYGIQNLVGRVTIYEGKYVLADVLAAAINSRKFLDQIEVDVAAMLIVEPGELLLPVDPKSPESVTKDDLDEQSGETRTDVSMPRELLKAIAALENSNEYLHSAGLHMLNTRIENLIWRQCENALHDPETALKDAYAMRP